MNYCSFMTVLLMFLEASLVHVHDQNNICSLLIHNSTMAPKKKKGQPQPVLPTKKSRGPLSKKLSSTPAKVTLKNWRASNPDKVRQHQRTAYKKLKEKRSLEKLREASSSVEQFTTNTTTNTTTNPPPPPQEKLADSVFSNRKRMADLKAIIIEKDKKIAELESFNQNLKASKKTSEDQYTNSFKKMSDMQHWEEYIRKIIPGELTTPVAMTAPPSLYLDKRDFDDPVMLHNLQNALDKHPEYNDIKIYR